MVIPEFRPGLNSLDKHFLAELYYSGSLVLDQNKLGREIHPSGLLPNFQVLDSISPSTILQINKYLAKYLNELGTLLIIEESEIGNERFIHNVNLKRYSKQSWDNNAVLFVKDAQTSLILREKQFQRYIMIINTSNQTFETNSKFAIIGCLQDSLSFLLDTQGDLLGQNSKPKSIILRKEY